MFKIDTLCFIWEDLRNINIDTYMVHRITKKYKKYVESISKSPFVYKDYIQMVWQNK